MKRRPLRCILLFTLSCSLAACGRYALTINQQALYTPPGVFTAFRLVDKNLQRCVDATIKEELITHPSQLHTLLCPAVKVSSLSGLEIFDQLRVLGLENNHIDDIGVLASFPRLEQLNLADNRFQTLAALNTLLKLRYINLQHNPAIQCEGLAQIQLAEGGDLIKPEHCH